MQYRVKWSKWYRSTGEVLIEANTADEAQEIAMEGLEDYEEDGLLQYDPDWSEIRVTRQNAS
nr:hypothetical protein 7 [Desulfobacterales bacterium]